MLINDVIKSISFLLEARKNGKYIMQDDILYRMMNIKELKDILVEKGFKPNMSQSHLKMRKRRDATLYDLSTEREQLEDVEREDVQTKRKLKLPKNRARGFFKSFSRGLNDFLSLNFNNKPDTVIVSFYKSAIKDIPNSKLVPFGWLKNFYDNYDLSDEDNYIAIKHEMEDRLYYNGNFLPFRSKDLKKYIKAVYINRDKTDKKELDEILKLLRKEKIEIRTIGSGVNTDNLTHLGLRKAISSKELKALQPTPAEDDINFSKKISTKKKAINDIENSNPLEYYAYNATKKYLK